MRVIGVVQGYGYGRGRATTMVELLGPLVAAGHVVDVYVTAVAPREVLDGVRVRSIRDLPPTARPDVVVYNSGLPAAVLAKIRDLPGRKLMCQHSFQTSDPGLQFADQVWFPSNAALDAHDGVAGITPNRYVSPPPINPDRYRTTPGNRISLCLSSPWKGGRLVSHLARAMPGHRFLVVKDGRGNGVDLFRGLRNVQLVDFLDPRDFYSRTRVQLFPSRSETYGRVGVEGAISGIPLVASMAPGIREAMHGRGIYLGIGDVRAWARTVTRLMDDDAAWNRASLDVRRRGDAVDYDADQATFVRQVEALVVPA